MEDYSLISDDEDHCKPEHFKINIYPQNAMNMLFST